MIAADLGQLELQSTWSETDPTFGARISFPVSIREGAAASSAIYFEIDPGKHCGMHTDSAEELVVVLAGAGEVQVGDERKDVSTGALAVVPALLRHDVTNTGTQTLRILGAFTSATVVTIFDDVLMPLGSRVAGTPLPSVK